MENEKQVQNEDEISLLDLFTVLLRYRKLIICITLISAVLAVAGYFFYPALQYKNASKDSQYQARALFTIKQQALPFVTVSLEKLINDAGIVLDSMRDAGMDTFQGMSLADETARSRILFSIDEWIEANSKENISKKGAVSKSGNVLQINAPSAPSKSDISPAVEVCFRSNNVEQVKSFIQFLFIRGNEKIVSYLRSDMEAIVQNYERLRNAANSSQAAQQFLAENFTQYTFLRNVLDKKETVLVQISEPVITEEAPQFSLTSLKNSYKIKGVIVVFASFFIAVLLAFALNAIGNIKNDEEAMQKIRDALGDSGNK